MKKFWTRERVVNHLKYRSAVCRRSLMMKVPLISEDEAVVLDDAECEAIKTLTKTGKRRHFVKKPCMQLYGPLESSMMYGTDGGGHHPLGAG